MIIDNLIYLEDSENIHVQNNYYTKESIWLCKNIYIMLDIIKEYIKRVYVGGGNLKILFFLLLCKRIRLLDKIVLSPLTDLKGKMWSLYHM